MNELTTFHKNGDEGSFVNNGHFVQRSLSIGGVNDPLEHEAESMADRVMRMPEPSIVQRKCAHCEEEEKVQRRPLAAFIQKLGAQGSNIASDSITQQIDNTRGKGNQLDTKTQSFMENRFGADFSNVKIHTSDYAIQMSNELNAQAFTVGKDIYFNSGKYNPDSESGKHLLAHELTHTIQQSGSIKKKIQRLGANPGCSATQVRQIHQAIFDARGWINNATAKMDQAPIHARVLPALRRNFGPTYGVEANLSLIRGRIRTAFNTLGSMSVACDDAGATPFCAANHCGWAGFGSNASTLCTNPTSTLDLPAPFAIDCVLHESFHAGMSFMTVDIYKSNPGYPGTGTEPLLNADSYANFVKDLS